jgi:hypothetical protein
MMYLLTRRFSVKIFKHLEYSKTHMTTDNNFELMFSLQHKNIPEYDTVDVEKCQF